MKRKVAVLMALLAVVAIGSAVGQEWVDVGWDGGGNFYYLNVRSVEDHGSYVTAWVRQNFNGGPASYSMILYGFAKERRQVKMFSAAAYDRNNNLITNTTPERDPSLQQLGFGQWQYCTPGSMSEALWVFATVTAMAAGIKY